MPQDGRPFKVVVATDTLEKEEIVGGRRGEGET